MPPRNDGTANTGLFYVPANEWGMDLWNEPITYKKGAAYLGAGFTIKPLYDDYIGVLRAIDPANGEVKWEYKNPAPLERVIESLRASGLPE